MEYASDESICKTMMLLTSLWHGVAAVSLVKK